MIFLDYLEFQIIKINLFNKGILPEAGFGYSLKILDVIPKPDGDGKIKSGAAFLQRMKDFDGTAFAAGYLEGMIPLKMIVFPNFCPESHGGAAHFP